MNSSPFVSRAVLLYISGAALLLLLVYLHLVQSTGTFSVRSWWELLQHTDSTESSIFRTVYLPRIVIGILSGIALAASGVIFQTITKNPLAAPSTLGVHAGAYFFIVAFATILPDWLGLSGFIAAFVGGCLAAVMVFTMAGGLEATPVRMALAGLVLSIAFSSFTAVLQIFFEVQTAGLFLWGNGTLVQQDWSGVRFVFPVLLVLLILVFFFAPRLDILLLGKNQAATLGENVRTTQAFMFFLAVGLTAIVVSVVGPIGFIGLVAPHLTRLMGYQLHSTLLFGSMLWGAVLLIGADVLGRAVDPSLSELPVGAVTSIVGAPFLVWLILKHRGSFFGAEQQSAIGGGRKKQELKYPVVLASAIMFTAIVFFVGLAGGSTGFSFVDTWRALFTEESSGQRFIIFDLRLGRLLTALTAGMLLAMSGMLYQGILRNPLADPSVLGVTSGAGAGALFVLFLFRDIPAAFIPIGAIVGAFAAVGVILFFSWKTKFHPAVLALLGIALSAVGGALSQIMITRFNLNAAAALTWLSGSTYATGYEELQQFLLLPLAVSIPLAWYLAPSLNVLALGDQTAIALGERLTFARWAAVLLATFCAAMAVAAVGTIGFIGLVAPHLARMLVGQDYMRIFPVALFIGGSLLVFSDTIGRTLLAPDEIPSGLVAAVIGTPFFLWLMHRSSKS